MGKVLKRILIVAGILLAAGTVIWIIGMSVIGWDFKKLDGNEYTQKSFAAQSPVQKIDVDMQSFPLTVVYGDSVSLEYYEAKNSVVSVECENGVLTVREKYEYNPFKTGLFDFGRGDHRYVLTVSDGIEIDLDVTNSVVEFDGLSFEKLNIDSTNVKLSFTNCEIDKLDLHSTNATVVFSGGVFGDVNIDSTNLGLKIDSVTASSIVVDSTNSTINMNGAEIGSFKLDSTNITVTTTNGRMNNVSIDGTNVDCKIKKTQLDMLKLDGTNLNANIAIRGAASEYSVVTHGKNMPSQRQGSTDKTITLKGTNNRVTLEFTE